MNYMIKKLPILKQKSKQFYYYCFDEYEYGKYREGYYGYEVKGMRLPVYLAKIYSYSVSLPSSSYSLDK